MQAGPRVELLGKQNIQGTHTPLMLIGGAVQCRLKNGALDALVLDTHRWDADDELAGVHWDMHMRTCVLVFLCVVVMCEGKGTRGRAESVHVLLVTSVLTCCS